MGPVRLDMHVHSHRSPDSTLTVEAIASGLASVGLNGFALTDHNTVAGHDELAALKARFPKLVLVPGVEVSTLEGHLLAYGVSEAPPRHRPVAETVEWVRDNGGVSVLSHPFRRAHGVGRAVAESVHVNAIETVNGHNSPGANRRAAEVAKRRGLGPPAGATCTRSSTWAAPTRSSRRGRLARTPSFARYARTPRPRGDSRSRSRSFSVTSGERPSSGCVGGSDRSEPRPLPPSSVLRKGPPPLYRAKVAEWLMRRTADPFPGGSIPSLGFRPSLGARASPLTVRRSFIGTAHPADPLSVHRTVHAPGNR